MAKESKRGIIPTAAQCFAFGCRWRGVHDFRFDVAHASACRVAIYRDIKPTAARMPLLHTEACATMKPLILAIEDDAQILRFLRAALLAEEYRLQEAMTAQEGMREAA